MGGSSEISVRPMSCSGWIICNIFALFRNCFCAKIRAGGVWSFYLERGVLDEL